MSALFITYLWHYLAARAIYDEVLRPLASGHPASLVLLAALILGAFFVGRRSATRGTR